MKTSASIFRVGISMVFGLIAVSYAGCPSVPSATLRVENLTANHVLVEINITPSESSTWGPNRLGAPLYPGDLRDIKNISPGTYKLRAVTESGSFTARYGVTLEANTTRTWTILDAKFPEELEESITDAQDSGEVEFLLLDALRE